jgi:hemolysin D
MAPKTNNPIEVLLVDDRRTVCEQVKCILAEYPDLAVVGVATDGKTALAQIEDLQPDVVLMDIDMPGLDGLEISKIVTQKFSNTKVIMLTGYEDPKYITKSLSAGATGYLVKAQMDVEIAETIRAVHRGYTQLGPGVFEKMIPEGQTVSQIFTPQVKKIEQVAEDGIDGRFVGDVHSKFTDVQSRVTGIARTAITKLDDWSNSAKELIDTIPLPWTRGLLYFLVFFLAGFVPWACLYQVDEIGVAQGRLEPQGDTIKREADIEGSVAVLKVHVKKGDRVKAGQPLIELDSKNVREQLQQNQLKLDGQQQRLSQLMLMKNQAGMGTTAQTQQNQAQLLEKQTQIAQAQQNFNSLKGNSGNQIAEKLAQVRQAEQALRDRESNITLQQTEKNTQIRQAQQAIVDGETAVELARTRLDDARAEVDRYSKLAATGAIAQTRVKEVEGVAKERTQLLSQATANLSQAKLRLKEQKDNYQRIDRQALADIAQARLRVTEQQQNYQRIANQTKTDLAQAQLRLKEQQRGYESLNKGGELAVVRNVRDLKEIQGQIVTLTGEIEQSKALNSFLVRQLGKYKVTADTDGTIFELPIAREGAVVQPKQLLAEIAPNPGKDSRTELVFKADIPAGQSESLRRSDGEQKKAKLKFDEFPYEKYDIVPGKLAWVSPNSKITATPQGNMTSYDIKIKLDKNYISYEGKKIPFQAGQPATAEIVIRQRKIIDFILDPFRKLK